MRWWEGQEMAQVRASVAHSSAREALDWANTCTTRLTSRMSSLEEASSTLRSEMSSLDHSCLPFFIFRYSSSSTASLYSSRSSGVSSVQSKHTQKHAKNSHSAN